MTTAPAGRDPKLAIETGRYWAGVVATAVVAALVGVVGVIVFERVFSVNLIAEPNFFPSSDTATYALAGAVLGLLAGLLAYLLVLSSPRPMSFFGWIMALVAVVVAVLPLTWTDDLTVSLCTGGLNLLVAVCVWSLISQVERRTVTRAPATVPDAGTARGVATALGTPPAGGVAQPDQVPPASAAGSPTSTWPPYGQQSSR